MRKKILPSFENVRIEDIADEGRAIGKIDGKVIFLKGVIPGDLVDVQVTRKKRNYMEGIVTNVKEFSNRRTSPFCSHFGICGGCKWQNMDYQHQLFYKENQVIQQLTRIGKVNPEIIRPILASEHTQFYRNKLEFTFSTHRWITEEEMNNSEALDRNALGFHVPGRFDRVVNIEKCYLQPEPSNSIRNWIREYAFENNLSFYDQKTHQGFLRNIIIRTALTGETMLIVVFAQNEEAIIQEMLESVKQKFNPDTIIYFVNEKLNDSLDGLQPKTFSGDGYINENLGNLKFRISPQSFFQTNTRQAFRLYSEALKLIQLSGNEVIYDLYTGTGTIANFVASSCKFVLGIEYVEQAIRDAFINSEINNIKNTHFIAGDVKNIFNEALIQQFGKPDILITDPPRAGMHTDVISTIKLMSPKTILYISCNPATQARDIDMLSDKYQAIVSQPVDMFPHTHHVENIVVLNRY